MRRLIDELPAQLRWAAAAEVPELPGAGEGLVVGMGGSGFAGDVAAVFAEAQGVRVAVHKGYGLPGWAAGDHLAVVAVSHSGNTEETLSAVEAAHTAAIVEELARLAYQTVALNASAAPIPDALRDKHFRRKHGKGAYYGQG